MTARTSNRCLSFVPLLASALLLAGAATQSSAQSTDTQAWQHEFTPYLWAAGLDGTTRLGPVTTATSAEFDDILERLDVGLMGTYEARKNQWGLLFDAIYIKLSNSEPIAGGNVDAEIKQQIYTLAGTYRVMEGQSPVDAVGGLRYNYIKPRLDIGLRSVESKEDWWDPFIGARIQVPLADRWTLIGYADIGGFGVGSDLTWQLAGGVNYAFSKNMIGKLGYRHLKVDYDKDDFGYDIATSGVYLGLGIRF